jgi:Deoxyribonuclease NucA/NucB
VNSLTLPSPLRKSYIELNGGSRLYSYVHNPVNFTDPFGLGKRKIEPANAADHDIILKLSKSDYPETGGHIEEAIGKGHPDILTINRPVAKANRKASLKGIKTKSGFDRDEWPMAMGKEGGKGAHIKYIDPSDN